MCLQCCNSLIKEYGQIGDNVNLRFLRLTTDLIKIDKTQNLFSVKTNFQIFKSCVAMWGLMLPQIAQNRVIAFSANL